MLSLLSWAYYSQPTINESGETQKVLDDGTFGVFVLGLLAILGTCVFVYLRKGKGGVLQAKGDWKPMSIKAQIVLIVANVLLAFSFLGALAQSLGGSGDGAEANPLDSAQGSVTMACFFGMFLLGSVWILVGRTKGILPPSRNNAARGTLAGVAASSLTR